MKKFLLAATSFLAVCFVVFFLQSCLKDKVTHTYTILTPIYESKDVVLANIKNNTAQSIQSPGKIFLYGNYIFLNEVDKGVHIIDNSNPSNPVRKAFIRIPGNVDIAVKGNTLYADMYSDLISVDISDPLNVKLLKDVPAVFPERSYYSTGGIYGGFVADPNKIIVGWIRKDTTVEEKPVSRRFITLDFTGQFLAAAPQAALAKSTLGIGGSLARFSIVNEHLYAVESHNLKVISISNPADPKLTKSIFAGFDIETIYPLKDKLFIGSMSGLYIFDISNPENPVSKGTFSHARACDPVVADDNYAYVTLREGTNCGPARNELLIVDIKNITSPYIAKTYSMTNPSGLSIDGHTLFVCDGTDGLKVYNTSYVYNVNLIKQFKNLEPYDVIAWNKNAIVVAKDGLYQFDYSNPASIHLRSKLTISK
jgi:hypothetical protein